MAQFSLCLFGFQCPLLSNPVTCPFHQTYPYSIIKGRLGIISFLNLAFRRISCSCSMFIFMAINCPAPSNRKQTGRPVVTLVPLLQTVYSPHPFLIPSPSNPSTGPHIKHIDTWTHTHTHTSKGKPAASESCLSTITFSEFKGRCTMRSISTKTPY